jgi:hypothetical protein
MRFIQFSSTNRRFLSLSLGSLLLATMSLGGCSQSPSKTDPLPGMTPMNAIGSPRVLNPESSPSTIQLLTSPTPSASASAAVGEHLPKHQSTPVAVSIPASSPAPGKAVVFDETGVTKDITCTGEDVSVGGSENKITIRGRVGRLEVKGATNEIRVENAGIIDIKGVENRIRWSGSEPKVNNPGNENQVLVDVPNPKPQAQASANTNPGAPTPTPVPVH